MCQRSLVQKIHGKGGLKVTKEELSPERGKTNKSRVRRRGRESLAIAIVSPH